MGTSLSVCLHPAGALAARPSSAHHDNRLMLDYLNLHHFTLLVLTRADYCSLAADFPWDVGHEGGVVGTWAGVGRGCRGGAGSWGRGPAGVPRGLGGPNLRGITSRSHHKKPDYVNKNGMVHPDNASPDRARHDVMGPAMYYDWPFFTAVPSMYMHNTPVN